MAATSLSDSGSLTSRSTHSLEAELSVMENSHSPPKFETPINDQLTKSQDTDKGIVVQPPTMFDMAGDDEDADDMDDYDYEDVVSNLQKRKRNSINYMDESSISVTSNNDSPASKRPKPSGRIRGVVIGVWRDSSELVDEDKHVIYGFIDIHERLRTRIYAMNRRGEELIGNVPTGAGGCWVTFERILFDPHLKGLTSVEIKEYVKIRSAMKKEDDPQAEKDADLESAKKAQHIVAAEGGYTSIKTFVPNPNTNTTATTTTSPTATTPTTTPTTKNPRASVSRQSMSGRSKPNSGFNAVNSSEVQTTKSGLGEVPQKPLGVLLGYWTESDAILEEDKHAVFGVLSGVDSFRVKVARQTRDGRPREGNYPTGAGALWLHYDKVVFEPHLRNCSRPEMKEYCRIRQEELLRKESDKERKANEMRAVERAKQVVAENQMAKNGTVVGQIRGEPTRRSPEWELRHSARSEQRNSRHQAELEATEAKKMQQLEREKQQEKTRREVAAVEQSVTEAAEKELKHNLKKLNKVWVAQQAATIPGVNSCVNNSVDTAQEIKHHNGIKYERKKNGPFQGKLVSAAQILTIDGEDYVEYRILTKPSFF